MMNASGKSSAITGIWASTAGSLIGMVSLAGDADEGQSRGSTASE